MSLNQDQVAGLVGVTSRRIRQFEQENTGPSRKSDGSYDEAAVGLWLRARVAEELGVSADGVSYDYNAERARLTKAQADKTELEVAEIRGEVVRMPIVIMYWQEMVGAMRAKLLSIPTKAAGSVAPPDKLQVATDAITRYVHEALAEIAGDAIPNEVRKRVDAQQRATRDEDSKPAAEADAKRVVSRKAGAKPGRQRGARKVPSK